MSTTFTNTKPATHFALLFTFLCFIWQHPLNLLTLFYFFIHSPLLFVVFCDLPQQYRMTLVATRHAGCPTAPITQPSTQPFIQPTDPATWSIVTSRTQWVYIYFFHILLVCPSLTRLQFQTRWHFQNRWHHFQTRRQQNTTLGHHGSLLLYKFTRLNVPFVLHNLWHGVNATLSPRVPSTFLKPPLLVAARLFAHSLRVQYVETMVFYMLLLYNTCKKTKP